MLKRTWEGEIPPSHKKMRLEGPPCHKRKLLDEGPTGPHKVRRMIPDQGGWTGQGPGPDNTAAQIRALQEENRALRAYMDNMSRAMQSLYEKIMVLEARQGQTIFHGCGIQYNRVNHIT